MKLCFLKLHNFHDEARRKKLPFTDSESFYTMLVNSMKERLFDADEGEFVRTTDILLIENWP